MKFKILIVGFILFISVSMAAELVKDVPYDIVKEKVSISEQEILMSDRKKRLDIICENIIENEEIQPIPKGPHIWAGKKTEWCVNNFVRADGWQLSGKSKIAFDDNFNIRRIKVGLISPEIYGDNIVRMHNDDVSRDEFIRWKEMHMSTVAGVSISWRF